MERHVALLEILWSLWGGLASLVGLSVLLLAAGAAVQLLDPVGGTVGLAAGLTAGVFAVLGTFALIFGGVHVWSARLLRRRHHYGRVLALALAVINLLVFPFGTALGAYAMWVLLSEQSRRLFEPVPHTS